MVLLAVVSCDRTRAGVRVVSVRVGTYSTHSAYERRLLTVVQKH
jgi:hypothetical protein